MLNLIAKFEEQLRIQSEAGDSASEDPLAIAADPVYPGAAYS